MTEELDKKKETLKLPKEEQFPWALLTGADILFACGLLILLQGIGVKDATTQIIMFVASVVTFAMGGYLKHVYSRWLSMTKHHN